jgi:hydrogenase nickel incorporation protein HypA/HybF
VKAVHEYSLIQAMVDRVETEARARAAVSVHRLGVRIGELAGVDVDLFKTAFVTFRDRTICERAELDVEIVPVRWTCEECGHDIEPGLALQCPLCRRPARMAAGDEIILDRIEMEVA